MASLTQAQADLLYAAIIHQHDDLYALINHGHDHGDLSGLGDDDHTQYYNQTRGDARYLQSVPQQDHGGLAGLGDDDHTQYYNQTRGDARYLRSVPQQDHGGLAGLGDDDHGQYYNQTRGDARYVPLSAIKRMLLPFGVYGAISPMTATAYPYSATIDRTYTFVKWTNTVRVYSPNDVSNYWTVSLLRGDGGNVVASFNTSGIAGWTRSLYTVSSFSQATMDTSHKVLFVTCGTTGAPGGLELQGPMLEVTC